MRVLGGDTTPAAGAVTWSVMMPTLAWLSGLAVVLVPVSAIVLSKRQ
jgi:ABC-2 type transport system permease protein